MTRIETFTHETHPDRIAPNKRIRLVHDEDYRPEDRWALDTEEETKAAVDREVDMLDRGVWIVVGRVHEVRCACCQSWGPDPDEDNLWGIVVENSDKGLLEAAFDV